jgi:pimeloyl-ACP methyl ester carboxylesterase
MHTNITSWTGMLPIDDTALAVTDTGGCGPPILYLNGAYASQRHWKPVIAELGAGYRHISYDERARGQSQRSADYSFEASVRDLDAVVHLTGVERPLLVGWSYGAFLAVHWADRHPDRILGVVAADGAVPFGLTGAEARERFRSLFRRTRMLLPLARPLGLAARMTADQHADINIEINEIGAGLTPVLERVNYPLHYVLATGAHFGADELAMKQVRASLDPLLARNPNLRVSARVSSNHSHILRKDYRAIAQAVREIAATREQAIH